MRSIIAALIVLFLSSQAQAVSRDQWLHLEAKKFLKHLLAENDAQLIAYERGAQTFSDNGRLHPDIRAFLYQSSGKWKSVHDVAKIDRLALKLIWQEEDVVTVIYYPRKFRRSVVNDVRFLENEWMRKYFACEFRIHDRQLKLHHNFCFAETDGPFSGTY